MTSPLHFEAARATLIAKAEALAGQGCEDCVASAALGRILAEPVVAAMDVPPADNSAMDGYAVRHCVNQPAKRLPISQVAMAGQVPKPLKPGTAARVLTGAEIPAGADTVVIQENADVTDAGVSFSELGRVGANIRLRGQDVRAGQAILAAARRIQPQDIAMAAAVGVTCFSVRPKLRVALVATGSELVDAGQPLAAGRIYNSNQPMLEAMLAQLGCDLTYSATVGDSAASVREVLLEAASSAQLIITTGGVSVGDADYVKEVIETLGALEFWKVNMKPGKPIAFGRIKNVPILGLPGNPVSAYVTFQLLLRPFIQALAGEQVPPLYYSSAVSEFEHTKAGQRDEFARGWQSASGVRLYGQQSSGAMSSVVWANCLVYLPAGKCIAPGDSVEVLPLLQW